MSARPSVSLDPMTKEVAEKLTRRLLAGYPNLGAHDPEGYAVLMVAAFAEYPEWAGHRVIQRVDENNSRFPPSVAEVRSWFDDYLRPFRYCEAWIASAEKQLAERKESSPELTRDPTPSPQSSGAVFTDYEEACKAHGRPFGPFESERNLRYRG